MYIESKTDKEYMIGYCFKKEAWGKGYAQETARALCFLGFKHLKAHRIIATCDTNNQRSYNVMEKIGMKREALFKQKRYMKNEWRDEYVYAVLETDWNELYNNFVFI